MWTGTAQMDLNEQDTTSIRLLSFRSRVAEAAVWCFAEVVKFEDVPCYWFGDWTLVGVYCGPRVGLFEGRVTPWPRKF